MKLNEKTLAVLKNFASINSGVVLQKGTVQRSMSPEQTILVQATLEDDIPETFGIYDLNQFLGNITTFKDPELTFTSERVIMSDGQMSLNYYSCSPSLIISPPDKELVLSKVDVAFTLKPETLSKLLRLAAMNNLPNLNVIGNDGELRLQACEVKNDTSNFASVCIDTYSGDDFNVSFKTENLRLIPDEYNVELAVGSFAKFTSKSGNLVYFIALETKAK